MNKKITTLSCLSSALFLLTSPVQAQTGLTEEQFIDGLSTDLERRSGQAALATYRRLIAEEGCIDNSASPIFDEGESEGVLEGCTGQNLLVFRNVREIIHTVNDLRESGPTEFSLGSDIQGLGFALRWLAAEEYAAQGDISRDFAGGQVGGLSTRLAALRFGVQGFQFAQNGVWQPSDDMAAHYNKTGGAAGASSEYSPWGSFLNLQYGSGSRDPSELEVAFDMDLVNITFGIDYRINDQWTTGVVLGLNQQEVDFDGSQSIVEGGIESDGYSMMPFFMYQQGAFYVSSALGFQSLSFDSLRSIRYPSFNINTNSVNTDTVSDTDASVTSFFLETGYNWNIQKLSFEPYASITNASVTIDEFSERDVNNDGFDLIVKEQRFDLTDVTLGVKMQYTFTPKIGVFIPYIILEQVNQLESDERDIEAYYGSLSTTDSLFFIPKEELDTSFNTFNIGVSAVLRGGREKTAGGSVAGDIQAYLNLKTISGFDGYAFDFYTLGIRYTF